MARGVRPRDHGRQAKLTLSANERGPPVNHPPSPLISQIVETVADVQRVGAKLLELVARMQTPAVADALERQRQAQAYESTAGVLRRRALAAADRGEERDDLQKSAQWYSERAIVKRAGGIMPAHLRTPLERLELVGRFREQLADLLPLAAELEAADAPAFVASFLDDAEPPPVFLAAFPPSVTPKPGEPAELGAVFTTFVDDARSLVADLGGFVDADGALRFVPFGISAEISTETAAATNNVDGAPAAAE